MSFVLAAQAASINFATAANLTGGKIDPPMSPLEELKFSLCILMSSTMLSLPYLVNATMLWSPRPKTR